MAHFSGYLAATYDEEQQKWIVDRELTYYSDKLPMRCVTVPVGFPSDLASVPRGLWNLFPRDGRYNRAAVLHDYLYATGLVSRDIADAIFLEAMGLVGVGWLPRHLMFWAVRGFGGFPWKKCRKMVGDVCTR